MKKTIAIGLLGPVLDEGFSVKRWERWRPTVALCQHEDLLVHRFELLHQKKFWRLANQVIEDIKDISPETEVRSHGIEFRDPWNLEEVYSSLLDFARGYSFDTDKEEYLIHITTGTHVAQICLYLLTEAHYLPGRLIQTSPSGKRNATEPGNFTIIDLDLSKYDRIASRFQKEHKEAVSFLKSGIETRNAYFNRLIERIEKVGAVSKSPILLMGPTGSGKSQLARNIFQLKQSRRKIEGSFVEVNCATLRGELAMGTLFGHRKGAFTGALDDRPGLLKSADKGMLFLDEIGELGVDEQAMLLRALEEKRFLPVGADKEASSDFQLIAGTNHDLSRQVQEGKFREDLLARINVWTFTLPGLKDRREDIEPNIEYELEKFSRDNQIYIRFNKEARKRFLQFAIAPDTQWRGNFRDLNAAINRMATLASGGRINVKIVEEEIERLKLFWKSGDSRNDDDLLAELIGSKQAESLDLFDKIQLIEVLKVCRTAKNLPEAGRRLFAESRKKKKSFNDSDRLRKYLDKFGIQWKDVVV